MKKSSRLLILLFAVIAAGYFLKPSFVWYFIYTDADRQEAGLSGLNLKNEVTKRVDVSLINFNDNSEEERKIIVKELKKEVNNYNSVRRQKIKLDNNADISEIESILEKLRISNSEDFYKKALEDHFIEIIAKKRKVRQNIIKLGLDLQGGVYSVVSANFEHPSVSGKFNSQKDKEDALDNAVLMIENRINRFGVSETTIQKIKEQNKIVINLPGVKEATELRKIIETVGVLEFKLVSKEGSDALAGVKSRYDLEGKSIVNSKGEILPEILAILPPDTQILPVANKDRWGEDLDNTPYLVVFKESLLGDNPEVDSATVDQDNLGRYVINFSLKGEAIGKWAKATRENIGRQIAIILDDVILQSPVVNSEIPNGRSQISLGNLSFEELDDMAKILRSGSLNVPLEISEENTVGASLGRDTIRMGLTAIIIGFTLVMIFMMLYYSLGGIISNIALISNLFFLISGLAMFNGTLTLPGIAGIILTVGMAVDANVIIYERVKEELKAGKTFNTSMLLGYEKAFWTIFDANITTFAAAIGISLFGTGPIKGFAVTLCIGIVSTLFCALFITKLMWDLILAKKNFKTVKPLSLMGGK